MTFSIKLTYNNTRASLGIIFNFSLFSYIPFFIIVFENGESAVVLEKLRLKLM